MRLINFKCKISGVTFLGIEYHVQNPIKKQKLKKENFLRGLVSDAWETLMFQIYFYNTCLWRFRNIDVSNLFSSTSFFQTNFFNLFLTRQKCFKFTFLKPFLMRQKYLKFTFLYTFERASKSGFLLQKRKFSFIGAHMPNQPYNWVG